MNIRFEVILRQNVSRSVRESCTVDATTLGAKKHKVPYSQHAIHHAAELTVRCPTAKSAMDRRRNTRLALVLEQ